VVALNRYLVRVDYSICRNRPCSRWLAPAGLVLEIEFFLLNLPLVLVILFLVPRISESRAMGDGPARPLDHLGAALATLSFAAITYALSFAPQLGWQNRLVVLPLLCGLVSSPSFSARRRTGPTR